MKDVMKNFADEYLDGLENRHMIKIAFNVGTPQEDGSVTYNVPIEVAHRIDRELREYDHGYYPT